ncbi:MAG: carbohydrate ABC transporter permease [Anaerolineae bacterium]
MYKWKIKQGTFRGLANYTRAMDNLVYVIAFTLAVAAAWGVVSLLIKAWRAAQERDETPWLLALPGAALALALFQFIKYMVLILPGILDIGEKVQRVERSRELYLQLFGEVFKAEAVVRAGQQFVGLILAGVVLWALLNRFVNTKRNAQYVTWFFLVGFLGLVGYAIADFTLASIQAEYANALESGEEIAIWTQIVSILGGTALLYVSWRLWQSAPRRDSSLKVVFNLLAAIALLGGAWILIGVLPPILEAGDKALWSGLAVTAWYSFITVPVQLALGLAIAYVLYQNIKGKSFFRMVYFLPYITPAVASAAVFRIMFSNRPTGMMNNLWALFGADPLKWLLEPESVFTIFGISGPSLALVVIIIFNVWTYSGYNAVIFLAGLGGIPVSLYEAAEIDGGNRWQLFRFITLPLLSPVTYFLSLLGVIGTFKAFNHVFVLRNAAALRTVDTMSMVIWDLLKVDNRYGYSAAMAFVLFGVVLVLTIINNAIQGRRVFYG